MYCEVRVVDCVDVIWMGSMILPIFIRFRFQRIIGGFGQDSGRSHIASQEVLWMRLTLNLVGTWITVESGWLSGRKTKRERRKMFWFEDPRHWGRYGC